MRTAIDTQRFTRAIMLGGHESAIGSRNCFRWLLLPVLVLLQLTWVRGAIPDAQRIVILSAEARSTPQPSILLTFPTNPENQEATGYTITRRSPPSTEWGPPVDLPGTATLYEDAQISAGQVYEYRLRREPFSSFSSHHGFVVSGVDVGLNDQRGGVLLVVDETIASTLAFEIDRLTQDLIGDGWVVTRLDSPRMVALDAPEYKQQILDLKSLIVQAYNNSSPQINTVFLLGRLPVPYSGDIAPDGHNTHKGAWPADAYYGDIDGIWTDDIDYPNGATRPENWNDIGDGKFDQSTNPTPIELMVGRVDLHDMFASQTTETDLIRKYLDKNHAYRHKQKIYNRQAAIEDNLAIAEANVYGSLGSFFGVSNLVEGDFLTLLGTDSYLWAYASSLSGSQSMNSIGTSDDVFTANSKAPFALLFGSWFVDWDNADNLMRAFLCNEDTIGSFWGVNTPLYHQSMGEPMGHSILLTQNDPVEYKTLFAASLPRVYMALMGDPTLRLHVVAPPTDLQISINNDSSATLSWTAPENETAIQGYHVYSADDSSGPFNRISGSDPVSTTTLTVLPPVPSTFMIRTIKLEGVTPSEPSSGSYFNGSTGIVESAPANENSPQAPNALVAMAAGPTEIQVNWGDQSNNEDGFTIEDSPDGVQFAEAHTTTANVTSHTFEGFSQGTTRFYRVRAFNTFGVSDYSDVASASANLSPTISSITDRQTDEDLATPSIDFNVDDADDPLGDLTISAVSSDSALIPDENINLQGTGSDRTLTLTPAPNQFGTTTIAITVTDSWGASATTSFLITVNAVNDAPVGTDDSYQTQEDQLLTVIAPGVLTTDTDVELDALNAVLDATTTNGTLTLNNDGSFTYQPNAGFFGTDTFTYHPNDGQTDGNVATVTLSVVAIPSDDENLIVHLTFDDGAGTIAIDASGNDHHATFVNDPTWTTDGKIDGALQFDGTDDAVTIDSIAGLDNPMTISLWLNSDNASWENNDVALRASDGTFRHGGIRSNGGPPKLRWYESSQASETITQSPFVAGNWYNYTILASDGEVHWYIDGNLVETLTSPENDFRSFDEFIIGNSNAFTQGFAGRIDDLRIYDRLLSAEEIQALASGEPPVPNQAPEISDINDQVTATGVPVGPIPFTVGDPDHAASDLTVTGVSSNQTLLPDSNIDIQGTEAQRTVALNPVPGLAGTTLLTLTVTDPANDSASTSFNLTVDPGNAAPQISPIANIVLTVGDPVAPIEITLSDPDHSTTDLVLETLSSNTGLVPNENLTLAGSGDIRTLTINPVVDITGTTTITLTVTDPDDATDSTSFDFTLNPIIDTPPTISSIADQFVAPNTTIGPLDFTINDLETDPSQLQLSASSSDQTLLSDANIALLGAETTRSVIAMTQIGEVGTTTVSIVVTDSGGQSATTDFNITVQTQTGSFMATFQEGANGYVGARDTKLKSDSTDTNFGSDDNLEIDASPDYGALLFWDLTSLPNEATVDSVEITLEVFNTSPDSYEIFEMRRPWVENEATWQEFASGQPWEIPGGNGTLDCGNTTFGSVTGSSVAPLTVPLNADGIALVETWIQAPSSNHGFILFDYDNGGDGLDVRSKEYFTIEERPMISINYSLTNQSPIASFDATQPLGPAPVELTFDATASSDPDGNLTDHVWDFGDGGIATGANTTYTFAAPGSFPVNLTVTDNEGAIGSTFAIVVIQADSDGDGLPDEYEDANGLDKNTSGDADTDSDGDGLSNLEEFHVGTDPNDSDDAMKIMDTVLSGADVAVHIQTVPDVVYRLERKENYTDGPWEVVGTQVGDGSIIEIIDVGAAALPQCFYQVVLVR